MKKNTSPYLSLITLIFLLPSLASAEVNSAAQASDAARPVTSPTSPNAAAISAQQAATASQQAADAGAAQSASMSASESSPMKQRTLKPETSALADGTGGTATTLPASEGALNVSSNGAVAAPVNRSPSDGTAVDAPAAPTITGATPIVESSGTGTVDGQIAAALASAETTAAIRSASATNREALFKQIDAKVDVAATALREMRRNTTELRGGARTEMNEALKTVRIREQALRRSLKEARRASSDTAVAAQAKLATDYQAYADAVVAAETHSRGSALTAGPVIR